MAAYAALVSLINITDQIRDHPRHSTSLDKNQIESLRDNVGFLLNFIETDSHGVISEDIQVLESQIAFAAYTAEDVIESHIVDRIQIGSVSLLNLKTVIEDMDLIKEKVMEFKEKSGSKYVQPVYKSSALTSSISTVEKMVGFDDELLQLLGMLTGHRSDRQIIPMGGTGKTTLAKNAYADLLIVQRFDIRTWVTVSQKQSVGEMLLQLLSRPSGGINSETNEQLGEQLNKKLWGRRYLVVVDDIWSGQSQNFLPRQQQWKPNRCDYKNIGCGSSLRLRVPRTESSRRG